MKSLRFNILIAGTMVLASSATLQAELTTEQEALTIARNYVRFILTNEGNWGGSETAEVVSIQEFKRGNRTLGYFCPVQPRGFLVLSLHKELAPVRAYSSRCNLNPENEEGLTDLIKDKMEGILNAVEKQLGRPLKPDDKIGGLLEINYRAVSDVLASEAFDPEEYREPQPVRGGAGMNYQEGEVLLSCNWHQQPPYNHHCPDMGCDWSGYNNFNYNARVGCVATAGAQVMYHWRWPPFGEGPPPFDDAYDWPNMCAAYYYDGSGWFNDENGVPVTWNQINAVANLCGEVGVAVDMDYGCGGSSATTADLEDAYEDYLRYDHDGWVAYRWQYEAVQWFDILKGQFNINRPVPYRVEGHAIVADGWKEEWIGDDYYWYHMNYGWPNDAYDVWWALDELYLGGFWEEYFIAAVVPDVAIGSPLGPHYPGGPGFWRYFDQDTWGINSTFYAGQWLQILKSGFLLVSGGDPGHAIKFYGEPDLHTRFFLYGDPWGKTRILIQGGGMKIYSGAGMVIH